MVLYKCESSPLFGRVVGATVKDLVKVVPAQTVTHKRVGARSVGQFCSCDFIIILNPVDQAFSRMTNEEMS